MTKCNAQDTKNGVFCTFRVICAAFLIYVFQLNGVTAKFRIWPDIRIFQSDKGAFVSAALTRQSEKGICGTKRLIWVISGLLDQSKMCG